MTEQIMITVLYETVRDNDNIPIGIKETISLKTNESTVGLMRNVITQITNTNRKIIGMLRDSIIEHEIDSIDTDFNPGENL